MRKTALNLLTSILAVSILGACRTKATSTPNIPISTSLTSTLISSTSTAASTNLPMPMLSITLGKLNESDGITLDQGGDVDTSVQLKGNPAVETRSSGNGAVLPSQDENNIPDSYV